MPVDRRRRWSCRSARRRGTTHVHARRRLHAQGRRGRRRACRPSCRRCPESGRGHRSNRLDLARWLVDPKNPLTARVTVNRFWQHYFGLGLVETDNDFGTQGTPPTHPELLDWLASEFIARGWSLKAMHRLIVTSATYRQSSQARPDLTTRRSRNRLLARQIAAAAGRRGGPRRGPGGQRPADARRSAGRASFRRSRDGVYRFTQMPTRLEAERRPRPLSPRPVHVLLALGAASGPDGLRRPRRQHTCTRRNRSNTPLQALTLLNDQAVVEFAQALAARVLREGGSRRRDAASAMRSACAWHGAQPAKRQR